MLDTIITTIIGSLIILAIGLSLKIAQLSHRLRLLDKENEEIRNKYKDSEIEKTAIHSEKTKLEKKISDLEDYDAFSCGANIR